MIHVEGNRREIQAVHEHTKVTQNFKNIPITRDIFKNNEDAAAYVTEQAKAGSFYHRAVVHILTRHLFSKEV